MNTRIIWFEIAAFVCSLLALPVIYKSKSLRIFPVLLLIIVAVEGYYKFIPQHTAVNAGVYNVQVPLQYVCYLLILYYAAAGRSYKLYLLVALLLVILFSAISNQYWLLPGYYNVESYSLCSLIIIIGIVWKFYEMLQNPTELNFLHNPFFYMLFAYLLFNLVTLPYFSMANWIHNTKEYRNIFLILANVMSVLNFLLYSTYSIAFIWMIRKKDIY